MLLVLVSVIHNMGQQVAHNAALLHVLGHEAQLGAGQQALPDELHAVVVVFIGEALQVALVDAREIIQLKIIRMLAYFRGYLLEL